MKKLLIIFALIGCNKPIQTVTFEQKGTGDFIIQDGNLVTDFANVSNFRITRPYKGHYYRAEGKDVRIYFDKKIVAKGERVCEK